MVTKINFNKKAFDKDIYPKIIDVNFTELLSISKPISQDITVDEFFIYYNSLFFDIPLEGDINSHSELIKRSTDYMGLEQNSDEIDLLLTEINQLKLELLEAQQVINNLTQ